MKFPVFVQILTAVILPAVLGAPAPMLSEMGSSDLGYTPSRSSWTGSEGASADVAKGSHAGEKSFVEYTVHIALDGQPETAEGTSGDEAGATVLHPGVAQFTTWLRNPANFAYLQRQAICFYSGYTGSVRAYEQINAFGGALGCTSMHTMLRAAGITEDVYNNQWDNQDWAAASGAMASYTRSPSSLVLLGETVAANSIWYVNEWPGLSSNQLVQRVDQYRLQATGKWFYERTIKGRKLSAAAAEDTTAGVEMYYESVLCGHDRKLSR